MKFNHIYSGVFIGSTLLGITGLVQWWNSEGFTKSLALTVGVAGTTSALICAGLGIAYGEKHESLEKETSTRIYQIEADKNRELNDLKVVIDNLKSSIKVLETQEGKYTEQLNNLKAQLNEKSEQYLRIIAEKDLKISELQGIVNERDQRVEEFLEDSRKYTRNFFSLRYNQLSSIEKDLKKLVDSPSIQSRLKDIRDLKEEMNEALEELKKLDIKDFKTVLDFIFEFDNSFLGMKVKWRNSLLKNSQQENINLKQSLSNSMPKDVAIQRFEEGLEDVDAKITEKYENLLLNNNSIHAQLLDLLEKRNLVINDLTNEVETLQDENTELQKPLLAIGTSDYALAANRIANYYHEHYKYKLDVMNWTENETGYSILFATRRNPGLTEDELLPHNTQEQLAAFTNCLQGTLPTWKFNYQHSTVTLDITLRKPVAKEVTVEDIFRECDIIRSDLFGQTIRKFHIEKTGKPTLRVMSATGGGKGIAVKNLVDYYLQNLDGYEIWLSDPQHGSEEDYWDCTKAATNPSQASKLFNQFATLLSGRDIEINTEVLLVVPEGFGAVVDTVSQKVATLDFGSGTTLITPYQSKKPLGSVQAKLGGVNHLYEMISESMVSKNYGYRGDKREINRCLESGDFKINEVDISEIYDKQLQNWWNERLKDVRDEAYKLQKEGYEIICIGGGVALPKFAKILKAKKFTVITDRPELTSARGLYKLALTQAKKKGIFVNEGVTANA